VYNYTCEGPNHAALLSTFQLDVFSQSFCFKLVDFITLFTLVLLRPIGGVIFDLGRDCIFNRSSDFCPRMAKGGVC
jgi:hypothetical protein